MSEAMIYDAYNENAVTTKEERYALLMSARAGDSEALERFLAMNRGLVKKCLSQILFILRKMHRIHGLRQGDESVSIYYLRLNPVRCLIYKRYNCFHGLCDHVIGKSADQRIYRLHR